MSPGAVLGWLRAWDPEGAVARQSARAGIAVPAVLGIAVLVFGPGQLSVFAAFAAIALLMFADFPGTRSARAADYVLLAVVGAVAVAAGTLASHPAWVAVPTMALVGTFVLFGGVLSATAAGGTRAVLLAWVWALLLPGGPADIPARLAGWGLAVVVCVPVAVLLWPPRVRRDLHATRPRPAGRSASSCDSGCSAPIPAPRPKSPPPSRSTLSDAPSEESRSGPSAWVPARAVLRLIDELERFGDAIASSTVRDAAGWPEPARKVGVATAGVLEAAARALDAESREGSEALRGLDEALEDLDPSPEPYKLNKIDLTQRGAALPGPRDLPGRPHDW